MEEQRLILSTTVARSDRILASGVCVGGIEGSGLLGIDANSLIGMYCRFLEYGDVFVF